MSKVLISYGLNPLSGIRLLSEGSWGQAWGTLTRMIRKQKVQVSLGAVIPDRPALVDRIRDLQFFIVVESTPPPAQAVPLLGSPTGLQIYQQDQGSQTYKTEVVRFSLGKNRRPLRHDLRDPDRATSQDLTLYR